MSPIRGTKRSYTSASLAPDDSRVEFRWIQSTLATVINNDVVSKEGMYYDNSDKPLKERWDRQKRQHCDFHGSTPSMK
jgi:hypothetical protein